MRLFLFYCTNKFVPTIHYLRFLTPPLPDSSVRSELWLRTWFGMTVSVRSQSRHIHRPEARTDTAEQSPQQLHLHQRQLQLCQASRVFHQLARRHQHLFPAGSARLQSKNSWYSPLHCHYNMTWKVLAPSQGADRKSTRLNSSHSQISYAVFCLKKK